MLKPKPQRKSISISISSQLIEEAKTLNIDISGAAEEGIMKAIAAEKTRRWQGENKEAIAGWNDYVRRNGLPLAKHRLF
ncbi:type II toxin-antitoxin system CcdA family antitoxin [Mesorhizobium ciceri]|uniref:type II toxin-antitoxin system CcdA family antitoxin n=1 Tax=Mesorhizobium TaxID=68287 RepID=UPI00047BF6AA|nr:type II toxin-antitoxin system CcdA family antitoxin [Mesorhizobium ciceri]